MFSWGSMYTLDENHHEGDLNVHRQGLDMIRSGAVKSSKNKDPNRSSIQRPFVMHHLCHIFASKRLPSKLYPPKNHSSTMLPKPVFYISARFRRMNTPQKRPSKNPPKKTQVDQMLLTSHASPFQSGLFQDAQQQSFFASSNLLMFFIHLPN